MTMLKIRCYSELQSLSTFKERYEYLKLDGVVGGLTFGSDRYLNQVFYRSPVWRSIRREVIIRDNGCDLGIDGYDIRDKILIHHMNPIMLDDLIGRNEDILDPEFLICTSFNTHNAIHYGADQNNIIDYGTPVIRKPGDTRLW